MGIAFEVYHTWEARKIKQAMMFLETGWQDQRKRWDPKDKKRGPLCANQCSYCKEVGHRRKKCLKFKRESRDGNPLGNAKKVRGV